MNKKLVLLSLIVMLATLMVGQAMGTTVKACESNDDSYGISDCDELCPPCEPPVYFKMEKLVSVSNPERVWQTGNTNHMRGLEVVGCYVMCDGDNNELPGVAILKVDSDVNVKTCQARSSIHIILDTDYGWWEGDMSLKVRWVKGDMLGVGSGRCILYGHGAWDCWTMHLTLNVCNNDVDLTDKMWNPNAQEWCKIVQPS